LTTAADTPSACDS